MSGGRRLSGWEKRVTPAAGGAAPSRPASAPASAPAPARPARTPAVSADPAAVVAPPVQPAPAPARPAAAGWRKALGRPAAEAPAAGTVPDSAAAPLAAAPAPVVAPVAPPSAPPVPPAPPPQAIVPPPPPPLAADSGAEAEPALPPVYAAPPAAPVAAPTPVAAPALADRLHRPGAAAAGWRKALGRPAAEAPAAGTVPDSAAAPLAAAPAPVVAPVAPPSAPPIPPAPPPQAIVPPPPPPVVADSGAEAEPALPPVYAAAPAAPVAAPTPVATPALADRLHRPGAAASGWRRPARKSAESSAAVAGSSPAAAAPASASAPTPPPVLSPAVASPPRERARPVAAEKADETGGSAAVARPASVLQRLLTIVRPSAVDLFQDHNDPSGSPIASHPAAEPAPRRKPIPPQAAADAAPAAPARKLPGLGSLLKKNAPSSRPVAESAAPVAPAAPPRPVSPRPRKVGTLNSRTVGVMKVVLPALAVGILGVLVGWPYVSRINDHFSLSFKGMSVKMSDSSTMRNPRYSGTDEKNKPYLLSAEAASQTDMSAQSISLEKPKADLTMADGTGVLVQSDLGFYRQKEGLLDLLGHVDLSTENGYVMQTRSARVDIPRGNASSDDPVQASGPAGTLTGDGFQLWNRGQTIVVTGKARAVLTLAKANKAGTTP